MLMLFKQIWIFFISDTSWHSGSICGLDSVMWINHTLTETVSGGIIDFCHLGLCAFLSQECDSVNALTCISLLVDSFHLLVCILYCTELPDLS